MRTSSLGDMYYFITFVDDFSIRVCVYIMRTIDRMLDCFFKWKMIVENQTGKEIKQLPTNNSTKYTNHSLTKVCQVNGII